MTLDELQKLEDLTPEMAPLTDSSERFSIPAIRCEPGSFFQKDDDGVYFDQDGVAWVTGWVKGQHVRRRFGAA